MTATGKKARRQSLLGNRYALRRALHTRKSTAKRKRMGWTKAGHMTRKGDRPK